MPVPPFRTRKELITILEREKKESGAELGVLIGDFAESTLKRWPSVKRYVLVDAWKSMDNYDDLANDEQAVMDQRYAKTLKRLEPWKSKIEVCRAYTLECAKRFKPDELDYVYVDAMHSRKDVFRDIEAWWPIVKEGGIMACVPSL